MKRFSWLALLLALQFGLNANSSEAPPLADDPVVEKRLVSISEDLRCLVCQNESLSGSRADLAIDLRREIRTLIKDGKSDTQIMDFMVTRYGDFILYKPPVKPVTWMLWFGPLVLVLGAFVFLVRLVRRTQAASQPPAMDDAQRAKAKSLLKDPETPS